VLLSEKKKNSHEMVGQPELMPKVDNIIGYRVGVGGFGDWDWLNCNNLVCNW